MGNQIKTMCSQHISVPLAHCVDSHGSLSSRQAARPCCSIGFSAHNLAFVHPLRFPHIIGDKPNGLHGALAPCPSVYMLELATPPQGPVIPAPA